MRVRRGGREIDNSGVREWERLVRGLGVGVSASGKNEGPEEGLGLGRRPI